MKLFYSTIVLWLAAIHLPAAEQRLAIGRVATQAKLLAAEVLPVLNKGA